jgi:Fic family protein
MKKLPEKPPSDWKQFFRLDQANDPALQKEVNEYNRRYLSWDELRYRIQDEDRRRVAWALMKLLRVLRHEPVPFRKLTLTYSFIPEIVKGLHTIDRYLSGTIQIHNKAIRLEQSYVINSLMEEAISSSILEGAATTRKAAKEMLRKGRKPRNHAEQMVLNNYEALRFVLEKKDEQLNPAMILELHRVVSHGTIDEKSVGRFRTDNDVVVSDSETGIVYHTPPDFREIGGFIDEFCGFANADKNGAEEPTKEFIHPVIKGIILHYLMGYLHPFYDGNGRTARGIFYWFVLSRGYWLFEYMPISRIILRSRKKYTLSYLYTEYDDNDLTYFIRYNISCITKAIDDLLDYLEKKQSEQNATNAIIKKIKGINRRQADILRDMMEHSDEYYTIRQIMHTYHIVYETARTDLLYLAQHGYVIKERRGREFVFIFNEHSELWTQPPKIKESGKMQKKLEDFSKGQ